MDRVIEVRGIPEILAKLKQIPMASLHGCAIGINESLDKLKITSAEILNRTTYLHKDPSESINANWVITPAVIKGYSVIGNLHNTSSHAAHVEFGTASRGEFMATDMIRPRGTRPLRFKIGDRWISKWEVQGQHPKAYLRGAAFQLVNQNTILNIVTDKVIGSIRSIL